MRDTFDVDFQHRFPLAPRHALIWGFGYRNTADRMRDVPPVATVTPDSRAIDLFSYFAQDEITLQEDRWYLTLGSKFIHSDFTPFEFQPTAQAALDPDGTSVAVGLGLAGGAHPDLRGRRHADHAPSRWETCPIPCPPPSSIPVFPVVIGNRDLQSEEVMSYEAGMRAQPTEAFSWDLAVFFNQYENLRSIDFNTVLPPGTPSPVRHPPARRHRQ